MTKQEAIQYQIDDVMDTFEFEDVHKWMTHTNWTWHHPECGAGAKVPDIYQLRSLARKLLKDAAKFSFASTGGFTARSTEGCDEDGPWIILNLSFGYSTINDGTSYVAE